MSQSNPFDCCPRPLLIVLSGPSGAGKDAVLARMRELRCPLTFITTVTTRPRRPGETDKVDYRFVSPDEFQGMVRNNELLESARVYQNWYGVPRQPVREALNAGKDVIVKVDVQGAGSIKKMIPFAVFIFLMPPSMEELCQRLEQRHTESPEALEVRTQAAVSEIKEMPRFDYVVLSRRNQIDEAVADVMAIIKAEKCRVAQREIKV